MKVARISEGVSTSDKCRIDGGSNGVIFSVIVQKLFCARFKYCNENERRYCRKFKPDQKKFTARQLAARIGFCVVETRNQVQNN